ncbi:Crp/Fnr family transcriptional regulator [Candidatus Microgenomates bacterium]|nr:Crp/Fnr family transcriptional regulator [Candidatus Microgenomates bacterium]
MIDNKGLYTRLAKIWESPDLLYFFKKYAKRPPRHIKKGTVLFNPGDPLLGVYFIEEGFIKLYEVSEDGKETIIYLTGPGNMLSLRAIISKHQTAHQYTQALTDVKLYTMTMKEFFAILLEHPEHLVDIIHVLVDRLNHAERRVEGFIAGDVTSRVASFLYDVAIRFGKKKGQTVSFPISLTHQRIADFVGSFRETVTLSLNQLQKEGLIKMSRGKIMVLNLEKLHARSLKNGKA